MQRMARPEHFRAPLVWKNYQLGLSRTQPLYHLPFWHKKGSDVGCRCCKSAVKLTMLRWRLLFGKNKAHRRLPWQRFLCLCPAASRTASLSLWWAANSQASKSRASELCFKVWSNSNHEILPPLSSSHSVLMSNCLVFSCIPSH